MKYWITRKANKISPFIRMAGKSNDGNERCGYEEKWD